jgi:AcrR family transcriptional regulator
MSDPRSGPDETFDASDTRERILRSAYQLFSRLGFARVSMREVATAAGVTKPALYYHFRNKEALFEECLADFHDELAAAMRYAARRAGSSTERVRAVAETLLSGAPYHPVRVHEELAEPASGPLRQRLRSTFSSAVVAPVVDLFVELEASGQLRAGVRPADAAAALIGACMAFLPRAPGEEGGPVPGTAAPMPPDVAAAVVTDLVLHGAVAG